MAFKSWAVKDPDERVRRGIDWSDALDTGDTITNSEWFVEEGDIEIDDGSPFTDTMTSVWLTGGTIDGTALVTNRVTTAAGEILDQTCKIKVKAK